MQVSFALSLDESMASDNDLADTLPAKSNASRHEAYARWSLVITTDQSTRTLPLPDHGKVVIGRSSFSEIEIDDPSVSRQHAALHLGEAKRDQITIEDLGSANGTRVRGRPCPKGERVSIEPWEVIDLGDVMLVVTAKSTMPARHIVDLSDPPSFEKGVLVVRDPAMLRLHRLIERIAPSEINIVLRGETGVGKGVIAERIHRSSHRSRGPFLQLNCAAFPETLLESELFGYAAGAFTGARNDKVGLIESASRGTVFLDELGEMPPSTQAKLLHVIESKQVLRLGETNRRDVDVRFVAATHVDLEARIEEGAFRRDLYFRLNGISLVIPPLRERPLEIEPLANAILAAAGKRSGRRPPVLSPEAMASLRAHAWPGNVRELINVLERAMLLAEEDTIGVEHLSLASSERRVPSSGGPSPRSSGEPADLRAEVASVERDAIVRALVESGGNQSMAAELLGISRKTLASRMDDFNLPRPRKGRRE